MFWEALYEHLFLNLSYYFPGIDFPINLVLLAIAIGISAACFITTATGRNTYAVITSLIRYGAFDEESALTVNELKLKPSLLLRASLSLRGQLTYMVSQIGGHPFEKKGKEEKTDFSTARFYLSADATDRARKIADRPAPSYKNAVLGTILTILLFGILVIFVPDILRLIIGY